MDDLRYDAVVDQIELLYGESRYADALAVLDSATGLEPWSAELAHLRACLLGASGDPDGALHTLRTAAAHGAWWRPEILDDDDLAALADHPAFNQLVATAAEQATDDPTPPLIALPAPASPSQPPASDPAPASPSSTPEEFPAPASSPAPKGVVVALHGAGQRAAHARRDWAHVLDLGYALVCVESSRRMSPMYRTWPDPEQARADIARALAQLPPALAPGPGQLAQGTGHLAQGPGQLAQGRGRLAAPSTDLGGLPLIAAGFSAGGRVALDWALTGRPVPVAGVLAMAPALRELPTTHRPLHPATIWIGTGDDLLEVVDAAEPQLPGITIHRIPGLGHAFPADFLRQLAGQL